MSGVLQKLMPGRSQAQPTHVVTDLDALIAEPVGFRFRGHVYTLQPVSTRTFLRMAEILGKAQQMLVDRSKGVEFSDDEFYRVYHQYISQLCPEFTLSTLKDLTLPQVGALLTLVIKHATGAPQTREVADPEKKKMTG